MAKSFLGRIFLPPLEAPILADDLPTGKFVFKVGQGVGDSLDPFAHRLEATMLATCI